jgi:hypothetical protein
MEGKGMNQVELRREEALQRAAYHRWSAYKGSLPGGNDPLTGQRWEETFRYSLDAERESFARAIHKAHARYWLDKASRLA